MHPTLVRWTRVGECNMNMSGWGGMSKDQQLNTYSGARPSEVCYPPGFCEDSVTLVCLNKEI